MKKSKLINELYAMEEKLHAKIVRSKHYNKLQTVQALIMQSGKRPKQPFFEEME